MGKIVFINAIGFFNIAPKRLNICWITKHCRSSDSTYTNPSSYR